MTSAKIDISELLSCLNPISVTGEKSGAISGLAYDSRQVGPQSAFFALPGSSVDGLKFVDDAIARGARVIVMEQKISIENVTCVVVEDARRALAEASNLFFGRPTETMRVVGVTGTNGKTTITYLVEAMLVAAAQQPAVVGTVSYRYGGSEVPASHTTPESYDLQKLIADYREQGADSLVMEVSSHALEQSRVAGVDFEVGIFTNLTPEHLDYHQTMDSYFASKKKLFDNYLVPQESKKVVNIDDPYGRRIAGELDDVLTCGLDPEADVRAENVELSRQGVRADIVTPAGPFRLESDLLGGFNVSNLLCAIAAGIALGLPLEVIQSGIGNVPVVPGRIETIENDRDAVILVDYAHTGDALENVLKAVCQLDAGRVLTVFGCGGDRDRSKRPVMGEVAARYSDLVIITSDNPRTESPDVILAEIVPGVEKHKKALSIEQFNQEDASGYTVIADRREALEQAIGMLRSGDLLLVAGKGHEDYQIIGTEKIHFDDREEIRQALHAPGRS